MGSALIIFPLFGEKYFLTSISYGDKQETIDSKDAYIEILNGDNRFGGKSVCNNFMGEWNKKGQVKGIASTMMMCSDSEVRLERKITTILNNSNIQIDNNIVVFENEYGKLIFVAKNKE